MRPVTSIGLARITSLSVRGCNKEQPPTRGREGNQGHRIGRHSDSSQASPSPIHTNKTVTGELLPLSALPFGQIAFKRCDKAKPRHGIERCCQQKQRVCCEIDTGGDAGGR